jgi:hypothetical protein
MNHRSFGRFARAAVAATGLFAVLGSAHAGLSFQQIATGTRTEIFNGISGLSTQAIGSTVSLGQLVTDQLGTVSYTYLGQESGYADRLLTVAGATLLTEAQAVGTTVSRAVTALGALAFKFEGSAGMYAINGSTWSAGTSIGLIGQHSLVNGTFYDYVLGYNDSAGAARLGDWDDFVIGINFRALPVSAVPEPASYGMMLLGLGLIGSIARRRKSNNS